MPPLRCRVARASPSGGSAQILEFARNLTPWVRNCLSSGAGSVSDEEIALWDLEGLSGLQTLRLTAANGIGSSSAAALVFAGTPERRLALGGRGLLHQPNDVATDADGRSFAADTRNNRIRRVKP